MVLLFLKILERWFGVLGTSSQGAIKDLNLYLEQVGKVEQSELVRASIGRFIVPGSR